jgi:S1-C subfamily serine protease
LKGIQNLARRKLAWLIAFLLLLVFIPSGLAIGRDVIRARRAERAERARYAELARQNKQIKQAETARRSVEETVRNALGFKPANVSMAEYPDIAGVFVASLTSEYSPAALAHIQAGDVLIELAGQPVRNSGELAQVLDPLKPGAEVGVKLYRDGENVTSTIRIADRSTPPVQPKTEPRDQGFLGLGDVTRRCCIPGTRKWGLEVHRVIDNSPADLAGLQLGDLITEFDGHSMLTPEEFARRIQITKPRSKVKVKFYRGSSAETVELIVGHGW